MPQTLEASQRSILFLFQITVKASIFNKPSSTPRSPLDCCTIHLQQEAHFTKTMEEDSSCATAVTNVTATQNVYSVWAIPPEDVAVRIKKLMEGLRSEFGGPNFEPHVTVVGAISLTEEDALEKFKSCCDGLKSYVATVDRVATGTFFYQCVYLLLQPSPEVVGAGAHCTGHFGYKSSTAYMPHLSLLYEDLTDEEKKKAQEKANSLDESINGLSFEISRLALWRTDTGDKTLKSWEKIAECTLSPPN